MVINTKIDRATLASPECLGLSKTMHISPVFSAILQNRGYKRREDCAAFFSPELGNLHDPYLLPDMHKAVKRTLGALKSREKILIYGDYDADGVTATSLLYLYLGKYSPDVSVHIPDRFSEGYGMSGDVLADEIARGVLLIITVDNGCKAVSEIAAAYELNASVVVTDHHECGKTLPACEAVVDPIRADSAYPFAGLSGVGVAFKFVCALDREITGTDRSRELLYEYADLIAIGTIADVMPLTGENRLIVHTGIDVISAGKRAGISALCAAIRSPKEKGTLNASAVAYRIAPRINAAGRMASAMIAYELMITSDRRRAEELCGELCALNEQRQTTENRIMEEAEELMSFRHDDRFILLAKEGWHRGVIGIAAARINEKYRKPVIMLSIDGDTAKGSGRSVSGLNLVGMLDVCSDLIEHFGGHEQAAGLTVKTSLIDSLRVRLNELTPDEIVMNNPVFADIELMPEELTVELAHEFSRLSPCGNGNEDPVVFLREFTVSAAYPLSEGKHTKLILEKNGMRFEALCFGRSFRLFPAYDGECVDVTGNLSINEYKNTEYLKIIVKDLFLSEASLRARAQNVRFFHDLLGRRAALASADLPSTADLRRLYVFLRSLRDEKSSKVPVALVIRAVPFYSFTKWLISADALVETGLLVFRDCAPWDETISFDLPEYSGKKNISEASIFHKIVVR
ncbi:MAG: single-stranded-DNA-specific exonuclease RecJ [Clostridia bacterium]|nr:single-stranded-DNA-specific exonuclease RecJ [Clostridia bacterium]